VWVGSSSIKAIVANQWIPGWLDRYLGRTGVDAQQDDTTASGARRVSNLWEPVTALHRVHGRFDTEASSSSPAFWLDTHRGVAMLAIATLATLCVRALRRRI
jgi:hypothetical protein